MNLTKIPDADWQGIRQPPIYRKLESAPSDVIVIVPDLDSFHEVKGMALILNKALKVQLLEPGEVFDWQGMFSPWHLNTDSYRLTFNHSKLIYERK